MAGLQFEGALDNITEKQLDFIKSILANRGFNDCKVVIEPVGRAGDNYQATVKRIIVERDSETFKMIAKIAPAIPMVRMIGRTKMTFGNETVIYKKMLPKFSELESAAGVSADEKLRYAECYGVLEEEPNETILLEDLTESGYVMVDRFQPLNDGQVKSILRNFAIYHALSFALKDKDPVAFQDIKNGLYDMWAQQTPEVKAFFGMFLNQIETNVLMILEKEEHKSLIKGTITSAVDIINEIGEADKDSKRLVIQQGDAWTNNILYKLDGSPIPPSVMVDYQQVRLANPVCDLHYMIFNCTDYQSRKDHYYEWIDYYYAELGNALSKFDLKANLIYPREALDADLKKYGKVALILAILLAGVMIAKPENAGKIKEAVESADMDEVKKVTNVAGMGMETIMLFKIRIEGIIASLLELGLI